MILWISQKKSECSSHMNFVKQNLIMYFQLDSNELCQINHITSIIILLHDFHLIMYFNIVVIFMSQNLWNGEM